LFLYFALKKSVPILQGLGSGATFAEVSKSQLEGFEIPLPPLPEQQRIAAILNEQLAAVERARAAAEAQLQAAKALPAAYLREVFESEEARKWESVKLGEICDVKGGKRLPAGTDFSPSKTLYPYIRVLDFHVGGVHTDNLKYLDSETQQQIARYVINRDDVYISIAGSVGIAGVIPEELHGANLTENAARLVIHDKKILHRDFLARFLQSTAGQNAIQARTNVVGQPKLALERIGTIPVSLPSLSEQERIVNYLNIMLPVSEQAVAKIESQLAAIEQMPAALLRRAFAGEL